MNRKWWKKLFHAKYDKEKVQGWKVDFQNALGIFNVCCVPGLFDQLLNYPTGCAKFKRYVDVDWYS